MKNKTPVFFHPDQLIHKPMYEWAFGDKIPHPESTSRAESILKAVQRSPASFEIFQPDKIPMDWIHKTHDSRLVRVFQASQHLAAEVTYSPSVFPKRSQCVGNPDDLNQAGFFCFDSGTPLAKTTWGAATWSAACAMAAGEEVFYKRKTPFAYSLSRPPGHHASRDLFGGYCYFNNVAILAKRLKKRGRGVILDIDFHHGNGTQQIFYRDPSVLFISIHGDPRDFYPYFSGYPEETGAASGVGFNMNICRPRGCDGQEYKSILENTVLPALRAYDPKWFLISAGFDTVADDPVGGFTLSTSDLHEIGGLLASVKIPTVAVQEGGYASDTLGKNVVSFLEGMRSSL